MFGGSWHTLDGWEQLGAIAAIVTIVGFAATAFALAFAFVQLSRTRTAAVAAQQAVTVTRAEIVSRQLAVMAPFLRSLKAELDHAIDQKNASLARRQLDTWCWQAGQAYGLLDIDDDVSGRLARHLRGSIGYSRAAELALAKVGAGNVIDIATHCEKARTSMGMAFNELSLLIGQQAVDVQYLLQQSAPLTKKASP